MKILLSIPNTGLIHHFVVKSVIEMMANSKHEVRGYMPVNCPVEVNMNAIFHQMLTYDYDYLINIDSDNPPARDMLGLVDLGLDMVGCPTPVWRVNWPKDMPPDPSEIPIHWNVYERIGDDYMPHKDHLGLQEVDAIGFGCFAMARRVLLSKKISKPWVETSYTQAGGIRIGPDILFCRKAQEAGFKIHAHFDYTCNHFKNTNLLVVKDLIDSARAGRPAKELVCV